MIFRGPIQPGLFYNSVTSIMDVLPQNCSKSAMFFFPSQLVRECSFGRGEIFRDCLLCFVFPRQVVPACIMLGPKKLPLPFQGYCRATSSTGHVISYRQQSIFSTGSYGGKKAQDGK